MRWLLVIVGMLLVTALASADSPVRTEHPIAALKSEIAPRYFSLTPDLKHIAFITDLGNATVAAERKETEDWLNKHLPGKPLNPRGRAGLAAALVKDKEVLVVDGVEIGPFARVSPLIAFSRDGRHLAFVALDETNNQFAVLDGEPSPSFGSIEHAPKFSADGNHMAYMVIDNSSPGQRCAVVLDGKVQSWCYGMTDFGEDLYFSPKGSRFTWAGFRKLPTGETDYFITVDGKEYGPYPEDDYWRVSFSPDGKHFAFLFRQKTANASDRFFLMLDGTPLPLAGKPGLTEAVFSPDSKRLAHYAGGKVTLLYSDGTQKQQWDYGSASRIQFSPDSQRLAFVSEAYNAVSVVLDGVPGPPVFSLIGPPVFSPNSRHLAYAASLLDKANSKTKDFVVVDGVDQKLHPVNDYKSSGIVFSADGEHYAYLSESNGRACAVVDGKPGPAYMGRAMANSLIVSSNGNRTAWLLRISPSGAAVVVDGKAQTRFDAIEPASLRFSPDGQHCAYVVTRSREFGEFLVVDGVKCKTYPSLLPPNDFSMTRSNLLVFDGSNLIRYAARTKSEVLIVEEKLQ